MLSIVKIDIAKNAERVSNGCHMRSMHVDLLEGFFLKASLILTIFIFDIRHLLFSNHDVLTLNHQFPSNDCQLLNEFPR